MKHLLFLIFTSCTILNLQAARGEVVCEKPEDCPAYMAQLQGNGILCTSFLVRNEFIATNLHCLPPELRTAGTSCKDKIHFIFPATTKTPEEKAECDTVQFVSQPLNAGSFNVDLAVLKLKVPVPREHVRFSQDGFKPKEKITIYKFDPTKTGGILRKTVCEPKPNSIYNPYFTSEYSPIINLAPCESISGNSGSPLIAEDGNVRGILHSIANVPFLLNKDMSFSEKTEMKMTFGTNMSCVHLSLFSYPRRNYSACDVVVSPANQKKLEDGLRQKALDEAIKMIDQKMRVISEKYKSPELMMFDWEVAQRKASAEDQKAAIISRFVFQPKCVALSTAPLGTLRSAIKGNLMSFEIKVPYYRMVSAVNTDLVYVIDLKEEEHKMKVTSTLQDWLTGKKVKLKVDTIAPDGKSDNVEMELVECPRRTRP